MCVFTPPVSPFRADTPLTSAGGKGAVRRFKQLDKLKFDNMRRIVLQFYKKELGGCAMEALGYALQIVTIAITLSLGLITAIQTRKLQHGQNIISVTTTYRLQRSEQLRECTRDLLANTDPDIYDLDPDRKDMLKAARTATESVGVILHRNFSADKEFVELMGEVAELAVAYHQGRDVRPELIYKRKLLRIKCDHYTATEWDRIKRETKGTDTTSQSWIDRYAELAPGFADDLARIEQEYRAARQEVIA